MDVLTSVPDHILNQIDAQMQQVFAEELVSALNCCRKYRKGMLVVHMDSNLEEQVCIKLRGRVRNYKALQALHQWLDINDVFELLSNMSGLPYACKSIEYLENANAAF
jgi:hypothetical protein